MARIVLLLSQPFDRQQAKELLASRYDVVVPQSACLPNEPFDLHIVDGCGLAQNWETLQTRKTTEAPRFLPILLIAPYRTVSRLGHTLWGLIDALIDTPAPVDFFLGRIDLLLGLREASIQLDQREALRKSEAKFRAVFEQAAIGMGRVSFEDARWIDVNDAFCRMLGYSQEELMDMPWPEITHPEDVDLDLIHFREMAAGQLERYSVEKRFIHKQGHPVWARLTLSLARDAEGRPDYEIAAIEDITERKQAEEALESERSRLQAVLDSLPVAVWFADRNGTVVKTSQAVDRVWGTRPLPYDIAQYAEYKGWWADSGEPVTPEDWALARAVLKGEVSTGEVINIQRFDGAFGTILNSACPVKDSEGRIIGGVAVAQDITDRKRAEDALRQLNESLEQRVRERTAELNLKNAELRRRADQLAHLASQLTLAEQRERNRLATVLHDHLQQLLVAAKFGLDEVSYAASDAEIKKAVGEVRQLLDESIVASRSLTVELSPTILHEAGLAAGLEWLARWMKHKHGLTVQVDTRKDAATDREDIRILLFESVRELLFNVVKHSGTDSAKVTLVRSAEFLEITVSDEGAGFDPDQAEGQEGKMASGLGLFSIRERLELLGGSLQIESAPGRGSRFVLRAPAARSAREAVLRMEQKKLEAEREEAALEAPDRLAMRVLLVDDHKVLRQSMAARLNREPDIKVVGEAGDGQEAIEKAHQLRPDVVLMDFSMPHMDGVEATQRLHAELPDITIIGLSMYEEADRANAMLEAGAATYVTKSAEFDELLEAIRTAAAQSH
ncbi:MAG: PAS domain S-box protein [Phycisphaerae bacterium]|nr:PAS domain S-box protein [Phycisphaerae bacterium]